MANCLDIVPRWVMDELLHLLNMLFRVFVKLSR